MQWVKIAHSFKQYVLNLFYFIISLQGTPTKVPLFDQA